MLEPFTVQLAGVRGFEWIILGAIILMITDDLGLDL